jgi:DNA-binding XRE family transcriptional regulator
MAKTHQLSEQDLAAIAKRFRKQAGITRAQAARDMGVAQTSIFHAEESPGQSFLKLRSRMIEEYSPYQVTGPFFLLKKK